MKKTLLIFSLFSMSVTSVVQAQQSPPIRLSVSIPISIGEQSSCSPENLNSSVSLNRTEKPGFWKELGDVLAATLIFSGLDYAYFQWLRPNDQGITSYRVFQLATQIGLSSALFYRNGGPEQWKEGLKVAGAFNLLWWTFNSDLVYYGLGELEKPGYFKVDVDPNGWAMRHAKWTAYGLAKSALSDEKWGDTRFTEAEIWSQALVGQAATAGLLAVDLWDEPKANSKLTDAVSAAVAKCQFSPGTLTNHSSVNAPIRFLPDSKIKSQLRLFPKVENPSQLLLSE